MTKQQAIRELVKLGVTNIEPNGRFSISAVVDGVPGVFDPRDLLTELRSAEPARAPAPAAAVPDTARLARLTGLPDLAAVKLNPAELERLAQTARRFLARQPREGRCPPLRETVALTAYVWLADFYLEYPGDEPEPDVTMRFGFRISPADGAQDEPAAEPAGPAGPADATRYAVIVGEPPAVNDPETPVIPEAYVVFFPDAKTAADRAETLAVSDNAFTRVYVAAEPRRCAHCGSANVNPDGYICRECDKTARMLLTAARNSEGR